MTSENCEVLEKRVAPPPTRTFELHWLHGDVQKVSAPDAGSQRETLANAMNAAGIGGGAGLLEGD